MFNRRTLLTAVGASMLLGSVTVAWGQDKMYIPPRASSTSSGRP